jgi:hypothetical protein
MNADAPTSSDRTRSQWLMMLALNAMLMIALYIYKLLYNIPGEVYTQLLADYHFGFIKGLCSVHSPAFFFQLCRCGRLTSMERLSCL